MTSAPTVFRPELRMTIMNTGASVLVAGVGVMLLVVVLSAEESPLWLAPVTAAVAITGLWMAVRAPRMQISYDSEALHITGLFRSRRIPRSAIIEIERWDLDWPRVRWGLDGGSDRYSTLTPLWLSSGPLVSGAMHLRRHRYLARLRRWAPESPLGEVRPGAESRALEGIGKVAVGLASSPPARVVLAVVLLAIAVWAYAAGWNALRGVADGTREFTRDVGFAVVTAGVALEWAYWALPLRRRHTRAWHVALAVAMAPLAVLLGLALFG